MSEHPMPDLEALERLLKEATPGRWALAGKLPMIRREWESAKDEFGSVVVGECGNFRDKEIARYNMPRWLADANLIVALVNAAPALISEAREAGRLRLALQRIADPSAVCTPVGAGDGGTYVISGSAYVEAREIALKALSPITTPDATDGET